MSGQSDAAAERSFHAAPITDAAPAVFTEVRPGVYRLTCLVQAEAEIARLRAALGLNPESQT